MAIKINTIYEPLLDQDKFVPEYMGRTWDEINISDHVTDYPNNIIELTLETCAKFAELTGDFNPIHLDPEFARRTQHRQRIVHGALLFSYAVGQYHRSQYTYGNTLAFLSASIKFIKPAYYGDKVYFEFFVVSKEKNPAVKRGIVHYDSYLRKLPDHEAILELKQEVLVNRYRRKSIITQKPEEIEPVTVKIKSATDKSAYPPAAVQITHSPQKSHREISKS